MHAFKQDKKISNHDGNCMKHCRKEQLIMELTDSSELQFIWEMTETCPVC